MKKSDIQVGKIYSNGKQERHYAERKVLEIKVDDAGILRVKYQHIRGYKHWCYDDITSCSIDGFAAWAKNEVGE